MYKCVATSVARHTHTQTHRDTGSCIYTHTHTHKQEHAHIDSCGHESWQPFIVTFRARHVWTIHVGLQLFGHAQSVMIMYPSVFGGPHPVCIFFQIDSWICTWHPRQWGLNNRSDCLKGAVAGRSWATKLWLLVSLTLWGQNLHMILEASFGETSTVHIHLHIYHICIQQTHTHIYYIEIQNDTNINHTYISSHVRP